MLFFFNDTATTEIYTLSLHDALPISFACLALSAAACCSAFFCSSVWLLGVEPGRSEEHTSELQSRGHLVCRLLLEKRKQYINLAAIEHATTIMNVTDHSCRYHNPADR